MYRIAVFLVVIKSGSCVRPVHSNHVYQSARLIDNNSALLMSASQLIRMWASLVQLPSCYYEATLASLYPVLCSFSLARFLCSMFLPFSSNYSFRNLLVQIHHIACIIQFCRLTFLFCCRVQGIQLRVSSIQLEAVF